MMMAVLATDTAALFRTALQRSKMFILVVVCWRMAGAA